MEECANCGNKVHHANVVGAGFCSETCEDDYFDEQAKRYYGDDVNRDELPEDWVF